MKKQQKGGRRSDRGEFRSGSKTDRRPSGRNSERTGSRKPSFSDREKKDERKPFRDKPFKRYPDADKSEEGWTRADGKPLRRRLSKENEKPERRNSFQRERRAEAGSFGEKRKTGTGNFRRSREDNPNKFGERRIQKSEGREKENRREHRSKSEDNRPFSKGKENTERKRGKSFIRSASEDSRPFERFEIKPQRSKGRKEIQGRSSSVRSTSSRTTTSTGDSEGLIRLNRFLSNAGICSRREADEFIEAGLVSVNGKIVTELGTKVSVSDDVRYNGERLKPEKNVYLLLNKPKDYITTADDPGGRKTVMELIARACRERVYPVGRLDRNTTGVLLFTNDGELAKQLTHPSSNIRKVYHVELDKSLKKNDMQQMMEGIELEDGPAVVDDIAYDAGGDKSQIGLELHSGKNRIVRRMFEHLGYEVRKLDRVMFAGLTKKDLPRGRWRMLSDIEVASLKMLVGKGKKKKQEGKSQLKLF